MTDALQVNDDDDDDDDDDDELLLNYCWILLVWFAVTIYH